MLCLSFGPIYQSTWWSCLFFQCLQLSLPPSPLPPPPLLPLPPSLHWERVQPLGLVAVLSSLSLSPQNQPVDYHPSALPLMHHWSSLQGWVLGLHSLKLPISFCVGAILNPCHHQTAGIGDWRELRELREEGREKGREGGRKEVKEGEREEEWEEDLSYLYIVLYQL